MIPLLDRRARPRGAQIGVIAIAALLAGAGACWLAHAIDSDPGRGWGLGSGVGAGTVLLVVWLATRGSRIVVADDGVLTYSLYGRANLAFDLRQASKLRPIQAGLLTGVGVELIDPTQVRFLHKAGISPLRMRCWRDELGVDVVLEGFPPEVADELAALRARLPSAAGVDGPVS